MKSARRMTVNINIRDVERWRPPNFIRVKGGLGCIDIAELGDHDLMMLALRWQGDLKRNAKKRRKERAKFQSAEVTP